MTKDQGRRVVLAEYPEGAPEERHFRIESMEIPEPGQNQMLLRTIYLSLDPYMRGRMTAAKSYAAPLEPGEVVLGGTVSEVLASHVPGFAAGDIVLSANGWQTHALSDGSGVRKLVPGRAPVSLALGVLGMPGLTAYVGLLDIACPKPGETVVVSAASGAVGQVVGQLARIQGCRVVGIAGAPDKCRYVVDELGYDMAVNRRDEDFADELAEACPNGIDVYFESVGGGVTGVVMELLNEFARMPVCGMIAHYNDTAPGQSIDRLPRLLRVTLTKRVKIQGFLVFDHEDRRDAFMNDMIRWLEDGRIRYREDIVEGLDNAVHAFQGLLRGDNRGKLLIRVGEDPTRTEVARDENG